MTLVAAALQTEWGVAIVVFCRSEDPWVLLPGCQRMAVRSRVVAAVAVLDFVLSKEKKDVERLNLKIEVEADSEIGPDDAPLSGGLISSFLGSQLTS